MKSAAKKKPTTTYIMRARRKMLLVLDVEGTLFQTNIRLPGTAINSTIWQSIAYELGQNAIAEEIKTHEKWYRGDYASYLEWMVDTIRIHQKHGLTQKTFRRLAALTGMILVILEIIKRG